MFALEQISQLLISYQYAILFPIAILEGPIIAVVAGFLVMTGQLEFLPVFLLLLAGEIVGDVFYYCIGRYGGRKFVQRWGKYVGLNAARLASVEDHFRKYPTKTLLFGKTQSWGSLILVAAGISQMPLTLYAWVNLAASIPKTLLFMGLGYYFGRVFGALALKEYLNYGEAALFVMGLVVVVLFIRRRRKTPAP